MITIPNDFSNEIIEDVIAALIIYDIAKYTIKAVINILKNLPWT